LKVLSSLRRRKKPNLAPEQALAALERLRAYVTARAALSAEEIAFILSLFRPRRLAKGEVVQQAGDPPREMIFVARGCLRSYVIDEKGSLHVASFAPEDWWVSDSARFLSGEPPALFIDAIEASDVLLIDHASHQRMVDTVPALGAAYRVGLQRLPQRETGASSAA
jgi:CRP-like cAMP-binding protein